MKISELLVRVGFDGDKAERGLRRLRSDLSKTEVDGKSMGAGLGRSFATLGTVGMGAVVGIGAGFAGLTGYGVKIAADNETASVSFEVLLGSAKASEAFLKDLGDFAATTPFEFPELREAASKLIAAGTAADDVIPIMTALGDSTSAMGTGAEGIDRAVNALNKMKITGKVSAETMQQLAEAGVPAWDALASKLGVDVAQAQEMVTSGQVKVNDVMAAMAEKAGPSFARVDGMMAKQSETLTGLVSTFKDVMGQKLGTAAAPIVESLKKALPGLTDTFGNLLETLAPVIAHLGEKLGPILDALMPIFDAFAPIVADLADVFADQIGPILEALSPVISELAEQFAILLSEGLEMLLPIIQEMAPYLTTMIQQFGEQMVNALVELTPDLLELCQALLPLIPPLTEIAITLLPVMVKALDLAVNGLSGFLHWIVTTSEGFRKGLEIMKDKWKIFQDTFGRGIDVVVEKWHIMRDKFQAGIDRIKAFFAGMGASWNAHVDQFKAGIDRIRGMWDGLVEFVRGIPGKVSAALGNAISTLVQKGKDLITGLWNGAKGVFESLWWWALSLPGKVVTALGNVLSTLVQKGKDLATGFWNGIKAIWGEIKAWVTDHISDITAPITGAIDSVTGFFTRGGPSAPGAPGGAAGTAAMSFAMPTGRTAQTNRTGSSGTAGASTVIHIDTLIVKANTPKELVAGLRDYVATNGALPVTVDRAREVA